MPRLTIRLRIDPTTGKKDVVVDLESDADALPHEHEQMHRALVEKLIQGGIVKENELGKIIVERLEEEHAPAAPVSAPEPTERRAQQQGQ